MNMKEYIDEAEAALLHTYNRYQIVWDRGDGMYLYDIAGKKYLDSLKDNRTCLVCHLRLHTLKIIEISKFHIANQRLKRFPVMHISCHRKRTHCPSVKRMIHRDNIMVCMAVPQEGILPRCF